MAAANGSSHTPPSIDPSNEDEGQSHCAAAADAENIGKTDPQSDPTVGIVQQVKQTIDDSKEWIEAELDFHKIRLRAGGQRAKTIGLLIAAGVLLLTCSFITLLLGGFLSVVYYFGPIVALISVPAAYALFGYLAVRIALGKISELRAMVKETGGITGLKATDIGNNKINPAPNKEPTP